MDTDELIRARLADRLEACRTRQEKTRLVASILYYELDLGFPSAATVRQYTQHGSLNDIQRDLKEFQSEVKDRERIHLDLPGMPESLNAAFVEAAKQAWLLANQEADQRFESHRESLQTEVDQARQEADEARRMQGMAATREAATLQRLDQERELRVETEKRAESLVSEVESLKAALAYSRQKLGEAELARKASEAQFSRDLEAEREARKRDAEMLEGEVRFAKMQIEEARKGERDLRERIAEIKAERNLEIERYRVRAGQLEQQLGEVRLALSDALASRIERRPKFRASAPGVKRRAAKIGT